MKPPKLLIIEDDPGIQSVLRSLGPELGLEVECVSEGQLGIGLAEQQEFCAAILDLGLPDLGGIAVLKRLRELHPALPILLLTSRSTKLDKVLGLELGADDYLTKPFDFQELVARLRGVLRRKAAYQKASDLPVNSESNQSTIRFDELEVNFFAETVSRSTSRSWSLIFWPTSFNIVAEWCRVTSCSPKFGDTPRMSPRTLMPR